MERLTYDFALGGNHCWQVKGADNLECREVCERQGDDGCKTCPIAKAFDHLAAIEDILGEDYDLDRLRELVEVRHAKWKYFHKQNKAVCTNCSFERDLDVSFGRAIACPNCGAKIN